MRVMASPITSLSIVYSTIYAGADQRKYQSSASLAFVRVIHRWLLRFWRQDILALGINTMTADALAP